MKKISLFTLFMLTVSLTFGGAVKIVNTNSFPIKWVGYFWAMPAGGTPADAYTSYNEVFVIPANSSITIVDPTQLNNVVGSNPVPTDIFVGAKGTAFSSTENGPVYLATSGSFLSLPPYNLPSQNVIFTSPAIPVYWYSIGN